MFAFKSKRLCGAVFIAACLMTSTGYAKNFNAVSNKKAQTYRIGEDVVMQPSIHAMEVATNSYTIHHPGATYIKPNISLNLAEGDYITVSNLDGTESYQYPFGGPEYIHDVDGSIWSLSIEGDTAIVTVHSQREAVGSLSDFGVVINKYERGYSASEKAEANFQIESTCGVDNKEHIECVKSSFPSVYNNRKPTARLRMGGGLCTGFIVSGSKALLMTNNHCVDTQTGAARLEAQFEYQNTSCTSGSLGNYVKVAGKTLLKTDAHHDMSLIELADFDRIKQFGYYQLDGSKQPVDKRIYTIGHPQGSPKKASVRDDQNSTGYCKIDSVSDFSGRDISYTCDTEGGSSGSPVFDFNGDRVIGLHHFGGCTNSAVKIELILPMVKDYIGGTTPGDTQAPTVPTGLNGTAAKTSVALSWGASSDNVGVTGYDVYQGSSKVGSSSSTQYTVSGLTPDTSYTFQVRAKDAAGNVSALSTQISVTTLKDGSGDPGTAKPWSADKIYVEGDRVSYDSSIWQAQWWNQGQQPGASQWGPWKKVTGTDPGPGPDPDPDPNPGPTTWKIGASYAAGDVVTYNGVQYKCLSPHTAQSGWYPDVVPALWSKI